MKTGFILFCCSLVSLQLLGQTTDTIHQWAWVTEANTIRIDENYSYPLADIIVFVGEKKQLLDYREQHHELFSSPFMIMGQEYSGSLMFITEKKGLQTPVFSTKIVSGLRHGDFIIYNKKSNDTINYDLSPLIKTIEQQEETIHEYSKRISELEDKNTALELENEQLINVQNQQELDMEQYRLELEAEIRNDIKNGTLESPTEEELRIRAEEAKQREKEEELRLEEQMRKAAELQRQIAEEAPTKKPILYFYPEQTIDLNIQLNFNGDLTHTYPKYEESWEVTAQPNGTLTDENNQEYYALYWEGESNYQYDLSTGFVIEGNQTRTFLEEKLDILGLNAKERNEFIIYWLPILEKNPYNLIHFSQDEYQEQAALNITPQPETLIRIMMVYQPLDEPLDIPTQQLQKVERKGFTVVEWGGKIQPKTAN